MTFYPNTRYMKKYPKKPKLSVKSVKRQTSNRTKKKGKK